MDELATEIYDLVESSVASNTWKAYKTAVDSFQNFRQLYDMSQSWAISPILRRANNAKLNAEEKRAAS
jgi:hypothetical protein